MKKPLPWGFVMVALIIAVAGTAAVLSQLEEATMLRNELAVARPGAGEIERLAAENQRLKQLQISPAELAALRADHAALPRLRAELEALNKR
jgi:hypothetical protein